MEVLLECTAAYFVTVSKSLRYTMLFSTACARLHILQLYVSSFRSLSPFG